MPYSPPSGSAVGLAFTSSPPYVTLGGDVNLEFDSSVVADIRAAGGWMSAAFGGTVVVGSHYILLNSRGLAPPYVSTPVIYNDTTQHVDLDTNGIASSSDESTWIYQVSWTQTIEAIGWDNRAYVSYNVKVREAGAYNIPDGTNLILNWLGATYYPPDATNLIVEFGAVGYGYILGCTLFEQTEWGTATVENALTGMWVYPSGWQSSTVSSPSIAHQGPQYIYYVGGISDGALGTPIVHPWYIYPQGWANNSVVGTPEKVRDNKLFPESIEPATEFGEHYIAWEVQHLDGIEGIDSAEMGTPTIDFWLREVFPPSIDSDEYGRPTVALSRWVYPEGFETIEWGDFLSFNGIPAFPTGIFDDQYGTPDVRLQWRPVYAQSANYGEEFGDPTIFNFNQYVHQYWEYELPLTEWGSPIYTLVENVNRTIGGQGWHSLRFGYTLVEKGLTVEQATLGDQTEWGAETFIDFAIRYRYLDGWDSSQFGRSVDTIVYNNARLLIPTGINESAVGTPEEVLNLNRTILHHSGPAGEDFGAETFIDYAIRSITVVGLASANEGTFLPPAVYFEPQPIFATGFEGLVAAPYVYEHFNIAYAKSVQDGDRLNFGEPFIWNRNLTISVPGRPYDEYGDQARIYNQIQYPQIDGWDSLTFGLTAVEYRTKTLVPAPFSSWFIPVIHKVFLDQPELPVTKEIFPSNNFGGNAQGGQGSNPYTYGPSSNFGIASLNANSVYPEAWDSKSFGTPEVRANSIFPDYIDPTMGLDQEPSWDLYSPMFGHTVVVGPQWVFPEGVDSENDIDPEFPESGGAWVPEPRVTPHYIFAPDPLFKVDYHFPAGAYNTRYPWMGHVTVEHKNRTVYPHWPTSGNYPDGEVFGDPTVELYTRRVYPKGRLQTEWGYFLRVIWPYTKYIHLDNPYEYGIPSSGNFPDPAYLYETTVAWVPPFDVTVYPSGCDPEAFYFQWGPMIPGPRIELFNREVLPTGIDHKAAYSLGSFKLYTTDLPNGTIYGAWDGRDFDLYDPFGIPLVGPPRRLYPTGWDNFHCGFDDDNYPTLDNGFISHRIRTVYMEGWDSYTGQYEELFGGWDTTKIRRIYNGVVGGSGFLPQSVGDTSAYGTPSVANFVRNVYPSTAHYGYTMGSDNKLSHRVLHTGWEDSVFGDVDEWEAGKIKPYGPDTSWVSPYARMMRGVAPAGFEGATGSPSIAVPVYVSGIAELAFFGPYIINEWDCNERVVAVGLGEDAEAFGTASVATV